LRRKTCQTNIKIELFYKMVMVNIKTFNVYPDSASGSVVMEWNGYATSSQFREGTEEMLRVLAEQQMKKVLADIKDMVLIGAEDQKWMETTFLPRAIKLGFQICAIVKPTNYFNKIAAETISHKVEKEKLKIQFFDTAEEAKEWLTQLKI
jgi:hypothetical protein